MNSINNWTSKSQGNLINYYNPNKIRLNVQEKVNCNYRTSNILYLECGFVHSNITIS